MFHIKRNIKITGRIPGCGCGWPAALLIQYIRIHGILRWIGAF